MNTKKVPASAFAQEVHGFEVSDKNGEGAKSAPFSMVALSGEVLTHWYFGPTIQDLSGMTHAERIVVDYEHDGREVLGYANKFNTENGQLELAGALTPYKDGDRAGEVIAKQKAGVPYQASIFFPPSSPGDTVIEEVEPGAPVEVNGKQYTGPLTVFRKWSLRGVAVCPYGADAGTATHMQSAGNAGELEVGIMSDKTKAPVEGAAPESQKSAPEGAPKVEGADVEAEAKAAAAKEAQAITDAAEVAAAKQAEADKAKQAAADKPDDGRGEFRKFVEAFGADKGSAYFSEGLSFEDATIKGLKDMRAELDASKQAVEAAKQSAADRPSAFEPDGDQGIDPTACKFSDEQIKEYCRQNSGTTFAEMKAKLTPKIK